MDPAPQPETRPTLITKELAMRGDVYAERLGQRLDEKGSLYEIGEISARMRKELDRTFSRVYPYYDEHDRLICFIGTDKRGQVYRQYDILSLHEPSNPSMPDPEEYTPDYVSILSARYASYGAHKCSMENMFGLTSTQVTKHQNEVKAALTNWLNEELASYLNRYCAVINTAKSFVVSKRVDLIGGIPVIRIQRHDVHTFVTASVYATVTVPGNDKKNLAAWWMQNAKRATYERVVYSAQTPDRALNLWHGFPIHAKLAGANPENAMPILRFVRDVIASGDIVVSNYIIKWMAWMIQRPMERPGVALVIVSPQGSGKGFIFCEVMGGILGSYHKYLRDTQACGRFNSMLANCRMLVLDESSFDGKQASLLKTYITSDTLALEGKNVDIDDGVENHMGVVILANSDSRMRLGPLIEASDRRYMVQEASSVRCARTPENQAFWTEIREIKHEDIYAKLMEIDLEGWNPRDFPTTKAARSEKESMLSPVTSWWLAELREEDGELFGNDSTKDRMYKRYLRWTEEFGGGSKPVNAAEFWKDMYKLAPGHFASKRGVAGETDHSRHRLVKVPSVEVSRELFCTYVQDPLFFE